MEISGDGAGNRVARLAGGRDQVGRARRLVSAILGRDHPRHDDCVLLTSEIATNAVVHSRSGEGGMFTVTVSCLPDRVRICVQDDGSAGPPCAGHSVPHGSTGGRGLPLLDALSDRWGIVRENGRNEVWFEIWLTPDRRPAPVHTGRWAATRVRPAVAAGDAARPALG